MLGRRNAEIARLLDEEARPLLDRLSEDGNSLAASIGESARSAAERLQQENSALLASFTRHAHKLVEEISSSSSQVAGELERRTKDAAGVVNEAQENLVLEVGQLIQRIGNVSGMLGKLVGEATGELSAVERRSPRPPTASAAARKRLYP